MNPFANCQLTGRTVHPIWPQAPVLLAALLAFVLFPTAITHADAVEGFTEPYRTISVAAGEPGVIAAVLVTEGQAVKKDQMLIKLDTEVLEAALAVAKFRASATGPRLAAEAELLHREEYLTKLRILRADGHASRREINRAETDLAIAKARVVAAKEELTAQSLECKRIEAQIDRRHIRSPIDGIVTEIHREVGESHQLVDPLLVTLVQLNRLRVELAAAERAALRLQVGKTVELSLPEVHQQATGTIETISPITDAKSGTTKFVVVIENHEAKLRSGTRCLLQLNDYGGKATHEVSKSRTNSR